MDTLTSFIAGALGISPNRIKCNMLVKKDVDMSDFSFLDFKVLIPENYIEKIMHDSIWPVGVRVREFVEYPKNGQRMKPPILSA